MQNYNAQKEEQLGRNIFQTLANQKNWQVEYTKEKFNPIDLHLKVIKNGQVITASGEIKNRDKSAIKYRTHIITLHKIKALIKDRQTYALFINIIGDDIFIYNCKNIAKQIISGKLKPYQKRLPNYNVVGTDYHYEAVVEVDKNKALHYKKIDDKWIRQ